MGVKKAKYRVKNNEGNYEVYHLETDASQVITSDEKQFISKEEKDNYSDKYTKSEIDAKETNLADEIAQKANSTEVTAAIRTLQEAVNTKADAALVANELNKKVNKSEFDETKTSLENSIGAIDTRVTVNESEIATLKQAVLEVSSTLVYSTFEEFNAAVSAEGFSPKTGTLAFVIEIKKSYIYKGDISFSNSLQLPTPPNGWIYFDEVTSEVDLVNYLTKEGAELIYRKLSDKISEIDLASALLNKINAKADKTYVDSSASALDVKINAKADKVSTYTKEEVKAKVEEQMTVISQSQPVGKSNGHVWLEIL